MLQMEIKRVNGAHLKPYNNALLYQASSTSHNSLLDDSMPSLPSPLPLLKAIKEGIIPCASVHQTYLPHTSAESPAQHPIFPQVLNLYALLYYGMLQFFCLSLTMHC